MPEQWPVVESQDLYRDGWVVALRADQVLQPDGVSTARRVVVEHPGAAIILAVDDQDRVICLRQYRHAVRPPLRRAAGRPARRRRTRSRSTWRARELREEAALRATTWTHLVSTYPSPGISAEVQHLFLARGLSPVDRGDFSLEHEEADMTTEWVAFEDLYAAVVAGSLTDSPLVVAVLLARARGLV